MFIKLKRVLIEVTLSIMLVLMPWASVVSQNDAMNRSMLNGNHPIGHSNWPFLEHWRPTIYKPIYLLPGYYSDKVQEAFDEENQLTTDHTEVKFQLSFKLPIWREILGSRTTFYAAYSQLAYWQAYDEDSAFFREVNYAPEVFLRTAFKKANIDLGLIHESNGRGGVMERSWNRVYLRLDVKSPESWWSLSLEPWYIIKDSSLKRYNPDISDFLGYGEIHAGLHVLKQKIDLMIRNSVESSFKRGAELVSWSFPISTRNWYGYVQFFSGYGQSLIEYNHYTNALGIGFRWVV